MKYCLRLVFILFLESTLYAQSFELEQFSQLYRPRLRIDALYQHPIELKNTDLNSKFNYSAQQYQANLSVPIAGKLSIGAEIDFTQSSIKDLLKNSLNIKAWQVMVNARLGFRHSAFKEISTKRETISDAYIGSVGVSGIKLTRRFNVLFYSANVNFAEEAQAFSSYQFRGNATIGWAKIKGLRKYFVYGIHLNVSDKLILPIPFIGGRLRINDNWNFNYVLPVQMNIQFKPDNKWSHFFGFRPEGQRWGWYNGKDAGSYSFLSFSPYAASRYTFNNNIQVRMELGYNAYSRFRTVNFGDKKYDFIGSQSFYFQFTFNQLLGKSLLEQAIDKLL